MTSIHYDRRDTDSTSPVTFGGYEAAEESGEYLKVPRSHLDWYRRQITSLQAEIISLRDEVSTERMAACNDQLTGILNRRGFELEIRRELSIATRENRPLVICVFDLDKFKAINDTFGHIAGDIVLRSFADVMKRQIRAHDILARTGGEEFIVAMPNTGIEDSRVVLARMQHEARNNTVSYGRDRINYTFSAGIALVAKSESRDAVISRADRALYAAKNNGRDQYAIAE